jgi:hypothetical protein
MPLASRSRRLQVDQETCRRWSRACAARRARRRSLRRACRRRAQHRRLLDDRAAEQGGGVVVLAEQPATARPAAANRAGRAARAPAAAAPGRRAGSTGRAGARCAGPPATGSVPGRRARGTPRAATRRPRFEQGGHRLVAPRRSTSRSRSGRCSQRRSRRPPIGVTVESSTPSSVCLSSPSTRVSSSRCRRVAAFIAIAPSPDSTVIAVRCGRRCFWVSST